MTAALAAGGAALAAPAAPPLPAAELPRGQLVERVSCADQADQSYALYLPGAYRRDLAWPIVYVLDPRGRGKSAAARFQAGAERFGFIVASSYDSASDAPLRLTLQAMRAMWRDTHSRLRIDDRRVYAAGFSGTVRAAVLLARDAPGTFAGIVGAGAGFPPERAPGKDVDFAFFGTVGDTDFNHDEMLDLEDRLAELGLPHRLEIFPGTHQWPPAELATAALGWMELAAMRTGRRAADPGLVESLWRPRLDRARALDAAGKAHDAYRACRAWSELAADFLGLRPAPELEAAARRAAELAALPAVTSAERRRRERTRGDEEKAARASHVLTSALGEPGDTLALALPRTLADLRVAELQRQARSAGDPEDRLSARRLLNSILVQTSFYLPRQYRERGEHDHAIFCLSIAAEIAPEDPDVWHDLAAAHARRGSRQRALQALARAVAAGWSDRPGLASDPDFAPLHGEAGWQRLIESVKAAPAPPS
jgi:predicted esterase/DNA-binding SARP family transcriptional activator